jgi:hypothetical protein
VGPHPQCGAPESAETERAPALCVQRLCDRRRRRTWKEACCVSASWAAPLRATSRRARKAESAPFAVTAVRAAALSSRSMPSPSAQRQGVSFPCGRQSKESRGFKPNGGARLEGRRPARGTCPRRYRSPARRQLRLHAARSRRVCAVGSPRCAAEVSSALDSSASVCQCVLALAHRFVATASRALNTSLWRYSTLREYTHVLPWISSAAADQHGVRGAESSTHSRTAASLLERSHAPSAKFKFVLPPSNVNVISSSCDR